MTPWFGRQPRAWQAAALPLALDSIRARKRGVVSAIMGAGKSVLIAEVCASGRGRVVVTVPSVALVEQLAGTLSDRLGGGVGRYYTHAKEAGERVTICCLPSLAQLVQEPAFTPPALWIADECHKTECDRVLAAHGQLTPAASLGFSATPFLADDKAALSLWQEIVYTYGAADAIRDGVVVPPELLHWTGGEVTIDEAACRLIAQVEHHGPGLSNAVDIADAEAFAEILCRRGHMAAAIHSRMSRSEQADTVARLRDGRLKSLVHVNMLAEGVDMPWLRWGCLRRPVGSRVRFCQEVGRFLRASPGKDRAYLIDLHDLFGSFGLTYEAALGEGLAREKQARLPPLEQAAEDAIAFGDGQLPPVETWRRYMRLLVASFAAAGAIEQKIAGGSWRKAEASDKQRGAVRWALAGLARDTGTPIAHRKALACIADHADLLRRGDVSDLLSIGFCLRDRRRDRLPWPAAAIEADADAT